MSLHIDLYMEGAETSESTGIFIREGGRTREITQEEWEERFPGSEPVKAQVQKSGEVYSGNITHNLTEMAEEADVYEYVWRPEENGVKVASELVPVLKNGIAKMEDDPTHFKKFNASNGWGTYEEFLGFLYELKDACEKFPEAQVESSR